MDDQSTKSSDFAYTNDAFSAGSGSYDNAEITKTEVKTDNELSKQDLHIDEITLTPSSITENTTQDVSDENPNPSHSVSLEGG